MADDALARREARRKRILENSHNRLQLISNITNDECLKESPVKSIKTSIAEQNNEVPATAVENNPMRSSVYNGIPNNDPESIEPLADNNLRDIFFGEPDTTNDSTAFAFPKPEPSKISFFEKFTNHKYDLVFLSLFMKLLHSFSITTLENTYFFLPVILYTATKLFFFPKEEGFNYANILLLLNGISSQQTHKLISMLQWGGIVVQDVCIYLFVTICVESLHILVNNSMFCSI